MLETLEIAETKAQRAAVIHLTMPREKVEEMMDPAIREILDALAKQGASPAGPMFAHHLKTDPKTFDFNVGFPVSKPITAAGRMKLGELPGAKVARTVYRGPYERLYEAWREFNEWIEAEGLKTGPTLWEVYISGPESGSDPSEWRTQLNRPLVG